MDKKIMNKKITGVVVSTKMKDTVIVAVTRMIRHPLYKKSVKHTSRFAVDNNGVEVAIGDKVHIFQTKPISKTKHYKIVEKITL